MRVRVECWGRVFGVHRLGPLPLETCGRGDRSGPHVPAADHRPVVLEGSTATPRVPLPQPLHPCCCLAEKTGAAKYRHLVHAPLELLSGEHLVGADPLYG